MKRIVVILLCILWMGFIFYNSSNNGTQSNNRSYNFLNELKDIKHGDFQIDKNSTGKNQGHYKDSSQNVPVKERIKRAFDIPDNRQKRINLIVRKNAHAFEYFILAVLVSIFMSTFKLKGRQALVDIMFICLLYAVTDEFHQQFISGRTSLVSDVLIDFFGSLVGILAFYIVYCKFFRKHKNYHIN